uniref:non-specific serine/threonine protein kinase n=1 Tax=Steinernema glaseri TaxID=37863 RepID=A0A1I7YLX8_9BILA
MADNQSIQNEELIALESIFSSGELKVNRKAAWNAWQPIDVSIKIIPTAHSNTFVSLVLHVVCSDAYPGRSPQLALEEVVGLSDAALAELLRQLESKCEESAKNKDPVITELCEYARDFLYKCNKKGPSDFHEKMLLSELEKETEQQKQKALKEQQEKAEIEKENALRRERLSAQKADKERNDMMQSRSFSTSNEECSESYKVRALDDSIITIYKRKTETVPDRKSRHELCTEWVAYIDENQSAYVTEWHFEHTLGRVRRTLVDLTKFERDLEEFVDNTLRRLRSLDSIDQSLCSYVFVHLNKRSNAATNFKCSLMIGQTIDSSHRPLESTINEVKAKSITLLPVFASSAVCALKWLHDQHLYHGSVDRSSVWWNREDNTFKISDFFILPAITKLANDFVELTSSESRKSASPTNEANDSLKNIQQRDMFAIGTIMMDMCSKSSSDSYSTTELCQQFIEMCQHGSANTDQLLDHEYLNRGFFNNLQMTKSTMSDDPVGTYELQKTSRLMSEWAMRKHLGGGGFGDVILAKNKVDGNDYAIKRIRLNPRSEALNRKITREAKLFSRLNHPNIVRYYNAWIEDVSVGEGNSGGESSSSRKDATSETNSAMLNNKMNSVEQRAKMLSCEATSEWTPSFKKVDESQEFSEAESDGYPGQIPSLGRYRVVFSPLQHDVSCGSEFDILFEESNINGAGDHLVIGDAESNDHADSMVPSKKNTPQVLYIQMEFCPKSTLRNLINTDNLCQQPKKVWRIFREILNGLQYIHHQGMVHRDIKPMNILLGVNDQVKIGDFGLATRGDIKKLRNIQSDFIVSTSTDVDTMTRDVGTLFYMAPELDSSTRTGDSNEPRVSAKVDVYSTGIVLFEMFYTALSGMERVHVLKHLRSALSFPADFGSSMSREQTSLAQKVVSWMLESNPEKRPTVDQILASDEVPLVEIEVTDFQKMFSQVIRNKRGPLRKWAMRNLFEAQPSAAQNYLYDHSICVDMDKTVARQNRIELLKEELTDCFKLHAFLPLTTPSLIPYNLNSTSTGPTSPVKAMDESGFVFTLPACHRRNFIRYCNRAQIYRLKRYTFGKTFHRTDGGLHPNERIVCAVDAVAQSSTVENMAAEVLSVTTSVTSHVSSLKTLNWNLRIGHTQLIRAAMTHHGLSDEELQKRVLQVLYMSSSEYHSLGKSQYTMTRTEKQNRLMHMCALKYEQASALLDTLEQGSKVSTIQTNLRSVLKSKNTEVRDKAKNALAELNGIMGTFELLSAEKNAERGTVIIDPTLCYRPELFSDGFVFQLEITVPTAPGKETVVPVLAGGRYDQSLAAERHSSDPTLGSPISAIGFNLYIEVLANICASVEKGKLSPCTVMVCCHSTSLINEKNMIVQQLRSKGIATDILHEPVRYVQDLVDHCTNHNIPFLLVILDKQTVLVHTPTEADKGGTKMDFNEAVMKVTGQQDTPQSATPNLSVASPARFTSSSTANFSNVNILYAMKGSHAIKKKIENQMRISMTDLLSTFSAKAVINICVCELPRETLRQVASKIDRNSGANDLSIVFQQAGKMKQDFEMLYAELKPLFDAKRVQEPIILYSASDASHKVLL